MSTASRAWLRRSSAVAIVILLAMMAILIAQRFQKLQPPVPEVDAGDIVSGRGDRAVGIYTGFEFVERVAGNLIFELMSKRTLGLSSGWHEIEGVRLQFYSEGDKGPTLTCDGASFNIQTRDARLEGSVRIEMPDGAVLTTDAGSFEASSRRFSTNSDVYFVSGGTFGRAKNAVYDLADNEIVLSDGVMLSAEDGTTLSAPEAVYQRSESKIVFREGGTVRLGQSTIEAPRMSVDLEEGEGPPHRIHLSGGVVARGEGFASGGRIDARMERVVAERDGSGKWQVDALTTGPWITVTFTGGEGYFERTLKTWILRAVIGEEGILNLRAERGVCINEIPTEGPPRSGEAMSARVWFANGQATDVELLENVVLSGGEINGQGHRARMSPQAGLIMLHGDPTGPERVLLSSDRGRINCDQAQLFNLESRAEGRGNVQGVIQDVALMGSDQQGAGEAAHFASEFLDVTEDGAKYHLRENTRLWQGQRLLLADDVVFHHETATVRAAGHVRTSLPASQLNSESDSDKEVVVDARSLDYDQKAGSAIYRGNVHYSDPEHSLAAAEVSIFFNEANKVTAVEATGSVEMVEISTGRRMTGQRARREFDSQSVVITGSPVRFSDPTGNVVSGSSLTWNLADGTVSVTGGTETIYYPEQKP